jgi:hypothetical protein
MGAVVYLIIRPLLIGPTWLRLATAAVGGGTTLGALLVAPDRFDFRALDPPLLPVVLFVAIPILHLPVFLPLAEWWLADESWFMRSPVRPVRYTLLVWLSGGLILPRLLPVIGVCAAVLRVAHERRPTPRTVGVATWAGRALLVAIFLGAVANLTADVALSQHEGAAR